MSDIEQILDDSFVEPEAEAETTAEAEAPEQAQEEVETQPEQAEAETPEPEEAKKVEEAPKADEPMVPASVVGGLRQELRDLKAQLSAPKPQEQPAPDYFDNPQAAVQHQLQPFEASMQNMRLDMSQEMTVQALNAQGKDGEKVVAEALDAMRQAQDNGASYQRVMNSRNPFAELVKWHSEKTVANEIGSDPQAWMAKQKEALRKELEAEMVAKQAKEAAAKTAPSLAGVTGNGGPAPSASVDINLDEILGR